LRELDPAGVGIVAFRHSCGKRTGMRGVPLGRLACIDEDTLAAFAEGRIDERAHAPIEEHIADCSDCRVVLTRAAGMTHSPVETPSVPPSDDCDAKEILPGTCVGRYVIEALIGHGAMGAVYAANDPDLDRKVAVKLLRAETLSETARLQMRARLLREAQAMARLSHPEVITVYDVGALGDQLFVAMEHVDGQTLRRWRCERHRTPAEILAVYERAGNGLAAAHEAGLVHRDFKPDNVLVARDGRVRVTDFGLARSLDHPDAPMLGAASVDGPSADGLTTTLTRTGTLLGTPAYMAPEQLRGAAADARSDVFSFCVALYEALYGERPFAGTTVLVLQAAIEQGAVRRAPIMTRVPSWLRAVLLRGLRAAPERRFASMRALLDALRAAHANWWRRRGVAVGTATGLTLVALLATFMRSAPVAARAVSPTTSSPIAAHGIAAPPTSVAAEPPTSPAPDPVSVAQSVTSAAQPIPPRSLLPTPSPAAHRASTTPPRPTAHTTKGPYEQPPVGHNGALILD
jgi:serine/threonine protein kinase